MKNKHLVGRIEPEPMKKVSFPRKLKRDIVISVIRGKDMVGVYWADTKGEEVLFECPPKIADEIIKIWNNQNKKI